MLGADMYFCLHVQFDMSSTFPRLRNFSDFSGTNFEDEFSVFRFLRSEKEETFTVKP